MTTVGGRGGEDTTWREISLREDGDLWYHKKGSARKTRGERLLLAGMCHRASWEGYVLGNTIREKEAPFPFPGAWHAALCPKKSVNRSL